MDYDDNIDYKTLHLQWLKKHSHFRPKFWAPDNNYSSYFDYMVDLYKTTLYNRTAYIYLRDDYEYNKVSKTVDETVAKLFGDKVEPQGDAYFITINSTNALWNSQRVLQDLEKLFSKPYVVYVYAIFEYHSSNHDGGHPHIHMKLIMNKHKGIGRCKKKLLESALGKYVGAPNFLDVQFYRQIDHDCYLQYDKMVEKKEALEKDKIWRAEQGLPEFLEKCV